MNAKDLTNAMNYYLTNTIEDGALKCYELCERVHAINATGKSMMTVATIEEVAATVGYHAMQMNGEWDARGLAEIHDFLRYRVQVLYPEAPRPKLSNPDERAKAIAI